VNNGSAITNYEYSTDNGVNWISRDPVSVTSPIVVTGLTNGTTYTFKIRAFNTMSGAASSTVSKLVAVVPDAPTITGVTVIGDTIEIAFTPPASNGGFDITNYQYSTDGGTYWIPRRPASVTSPFVSYQPSGLYNYRIRALNIIGVGSVSNLVTVQVVIGDGD